MLDEPELIGLGIGIGADDGADVLDDGIGVAAPRVGGPAGMVGNRLDGSVLSSQGVYPSFHEPRTLKATFSKVQTMALKADRDGRHLPTQARRSGLPCIEGVKTLTRRPGEPPPSKYMQMQVINLLAAISPAIDDRAIAAMGKPLLTGNLLHGAE